MRARAAWFTTSWDDGGRADLRLARLMRGYGVKGTFYVPSRPSARDLTDGDLISLGREFEVGSHSATHRSLPGGPPATVVEEVLGSRVELEERTGLPVRAFAYPFGASDPAAVAAVRAAGYTVARTTEPFDFDLPADPLRAGVSLQVHPLTLRRLLASLARRPRALATAAVPWAQAAGRWHDVAMALVQRVERRGGLVHLWGHSADLERYDLWEPLEQVFDYVASQDAVDKIPNGALGGGCI